MKALGSENIKVVNRAAWALGNLESWSAPCPDSWRLVTSTRSGSSWCRRTEAASGGDRLPASPGPMMAFNGSSIAYLTPPAVGPGVVAYGAVSAPFYNPGTAQRE